MVCRCRVLILTYDQTMKRVGNAASNRTFNPKSTKPSIPVDIDEADGVMERFIRQKYEQRAFISGAKPVQQRTGSVSSDDQPPPPLPPKPGRKFGFGLRSTSSTLARSSDKHTPPLSPDFSGSGSSTQAKTNKQSRILGSTIGNQEDDFHAKLATLRDMGFKDTRRNSTVLKSMNGNVDRTVEALVRTSESNHAPSGTLTPVSTSSATNGITVEKRRPAEDKLANPFDALDRETSQQTQRSVTMPVHQTVQQQQAFHPQQHFFNSQPDMSGLNAGFQSIQLSQQQQVPHQQSQAYGQGSNPFQAQQATLQPISSYGGATFPQSVSPQPPNTFQSQAQDTTNPFLRRVQSQTFSPSNPWPQQSTPLRTQSPATNPFHSIPGAQASQSQSPFGFVAPQNDFFGGTPQPLQSPTYASSNPFMNQTSQQSSTPTNMYQQHIFAPTSQVQTSPFQPVDHQQQFTPSHIPLSNTQPPTNPQISSQQQQNDLQQHYQPQQYPPPAQPASPFRHDKSSILALYGQAQFAPPRPLHSSFEVTDHQQQQNGVPQRSVTMPVSSGAGNMNPFAAQQQAYSNGGVADPGANGQFGQVQQGQGVTVGPPRDAFSGLLNRW